MATTSPVQLRLSVTPTHLLYSEILSVTSAMRKNSRWASSQPGPAKGTNLATSMGLRAPVTGHDTPGRVSHDKQESSLMGGFDELKRTIRDVDDVLSVPLPTLLGPFLALIRSPLSTGPITSTALASLYNLFVTGIINPSSLEVTQGLIELSNALAHCKFEASDSSGDEVVLFRIVSVIDQCQASDVGNLLGDVELCEMLETVLTICCQMRLSETLRRTAESAMNNMVRRVFGRLDTLDPSIDAEGADEVQASTPYGLPSAQELLRVLVNLLDPNDQQHTDSIRLTILTVLNAGLEASGKRIAQFRSLSDMLVDQGCKYLFQLARSDNINVLRLSLRVISNLFDTMRESLKLQIELFLAFTMDRLAPPVAVLPPRVQLSLNSIGQNRRNASLPGTPLIGSSSTNGDPSHDPLSLDGQSQGEQTPPITRPSVVPARGLTREIMLETLCYMARQHTVMVDLWVNYDCDVNCEDLFERLIGFLTRGVYPTQYTGGLEYQRYSAQLLCLDLLLAYVDHMAARTEGLVDGWPAGNPQPDILAAGKATKGILLTGASRFNIKPKTGLAYLEENGLIYKPNQTDEDEPRARTLAKFLKNTPRLDKKVLGEWISSPDNIEVLKEFIGLFDFTGKSVADAMRLLLEAFRLPGEAQPISRITETFADIYFASKPAEVKSTDAVYVLAYSVIMLNTDLYNPQNRKRMTLEDYQKNLKGVNDGEDFDPVYLKSIYDSIKKREIVLPEEHAGQLGFEYAWKALLVRTKNAGPFYTCNTSLFDREMFQLTWKSVISAIAYAFTAFDDDYIVERAIAGFRKCATLARHFNLPEVFDYVVKSLSHATGLLSEADPKTAKFPVVQVEGQHLTVSPLSIKFGTNFRGQLAAVVLFTIANGNGNAIREGWNLIFEMFQTLFVHSLLPPRMLQMEDFLGGVSAIPMQGSGPTAQSAVHRSDVGLLSALSSYLLTPYGSSSDALAEPTQDDIQNTLCTMDCIASCKLDELYSQVMTLEVDAVVAVVRALQVLADRRSLDILVEEIITDPVPTAPSAVPRHEDTKEPLPYDPSSVFLLETMGETNAVAEQLAAGLARLVKEHNNIMSSPTEWGLILALVRGTISHPEAAKTSFQLVSDLLTAPDRQIVTPENYSAFVSLLEAFATVASQALEALRQPQRRASSASPTVEPAVERGSKSIDMIADLKKHIPTFIEHATLPKEEAWLSYWLAPLEALSRQSANASREIRNLAIGHLQRILLGTQITANLPENFDAQVLLDRAVFPLLEELLKPQVYARDVQGMQDTRLRASNLLCKSFLHFSVRSTEGIADTRKSWLAILDIMDRFMTSGKRDQLYEAVPESLKNVVLVLHAAQILQPPSHDARTPAQVEFWQSTHERMERFLPGFLEELVPSEVPATTLEPSDGASAVPVP
ncbi:GDP/GTP exchange factor for ARF [Tulasnella sp. 403]|nr:GDP/GTP exchange factor for ARF [Tulasnella sp. 403]